ncbi:MAG TPA: substrate-binding domain-containing protein [Acidimicrobiales bacterium]|nr:substrate-binding domain-containing protein [Acidimicrobiales bacterium]
MTNRVKNVRVLALLAISGMVMAACGSSSSGINSNATASTSRSVSALAAADEATAKDYAGTSRPVSSVSRPAAKGKSIVIVSASMAASSSAVPALGAQAAAKAIGWKATILDARLNPSNFAPLIRQAVALRPSGIILVAIDCATAKASLREAKSASIPIVPVTAFDCTDPAAGGGSVPYFTSSINFGKQNPSPDKFDQSYGSAQANYIISKSHNEAKVIVIQDPEFTVLYWTLKGFKDTIDSSGGSQIVDTLTVTSTDLLDGQIVPKIQAELLRFPQANWIKSPYTYVTTIGIAPALANRSGHINVMGGEGFTGELDLIRKNSITATNAISSDWAGWAAVDTMNSIFLHRAPVDSGIGWTLVDLHHNLPRSGDWTPRIPYQSEYKRAWGVGG